MRIGISLNEVLRDYLHQLEYTVDKYYGISKNIEKDPPKDYENLHKYFVTEEEKDKEGNVTQEKKVAFETLGDFNQFLFSESSLEIFGHADQMEKNLMDNFNKFIIDIIDDDEHEIVLVSLELNMSIPATFFFLSKTRCMANEIKFTRKYKHQWDNIDVLITANPKVLECKPDNKISVKVKTSYNEDTPADFTIERLIEFIGNETLRNKIINTKITTYEEIG